MKYDNFQKFSLEAPLVFCLFVNVLFCLLFRVKPVAYVISQARGPNRTVATSLHHSHSNARSEPHLSPTLQLAAMSDP